jgi:hypothetical protein
MGINYWYRHNIQVSGGVYAYARGWHTQRKADLT